MNTSIRKNHGNCFKNVSMTHSEGEKIIYEILQKLMRIIFRYLKHLVIPIAKYSFYAGNVSLSTVQRISNLYERCKELLDTNGNGWSEPITDFSQFSIKILPVSITSDENEAMKSCASLVTNNDDEIMVPLPIIETDDDSDDDDEFSAVIKFPFKKDQSLFSINSKRSAFVLFRYYILVSQCFTYQGIDQSAFNRRFKMWINENVLSYLDDDEFYPAFGAVLRIFESIKDSHDGIYQGTKDRKVKRQRLLSSSSSSSHNNLFTGQQDDFSFDDPDRDFNWWINAVLASIGIFVLLIIIIYLFVRICCNRKKVRYNESSGKKSLKEKISQVLHNNTHVPEHDEYYQYKKVPTKSIKFENERAGRKKFLSKLRSGKKKDKMPLPRLNQSGTESEDEIVLHESKSSSKSSLISKKKEQKSSDESEDNRKQKKIFRTRSRSPKPRK